MPIHIDTYIDMLAPKYVLPRPEELSVSHRSQVHFWSDEFLIPNMNITSLSFLSQILFFFLYIYSFIYSFLNPSNDCIVSITY